MVNATSGTPPDAANATLAAADATNSTLPSKSANKCGPCCFYSGADAKCLCTSISPCPLAWGPPVPSAAQPGGACADGEQRAVLWAGAGQPAS
jgi:hypothetical protein